MIRAFLTAFGFLTILPISPKNLEPKDFGNSVVFFPVVGVVFGCLYWGGFHLLGKAFPKEIAAWLCIFLSCFLNGAIHWDGFADVADGLGGRDREQRLRIMKDSRLGAFGGIALIFLIVGKVFSLSNLVQIPLTTFISVTVLSRWGMAALIYSQPSISQGLLRNFLIQRRWIGLLTSTMLMLAIIALGWPGNSLIIVTTLISLGLAMAIIKIKFGGITGDLLGASNELIELCSLIVLTWRWAG